MSFNLYTTVKVWVFSGAAHYIINAFYSTTQGLSEDKQFIGESLLSRLQDDDPAVVACVLKLGQVQIHHVFIYIYFFNLVK